jgi:hypothetical protein
MVAAPASDRRKVKDIAEGAAIGSVYLRVLSIRAGDGGEPPALNIKQPSQEAAGGPELVGLIPVIPALYAPVL